MKTKLALTVVAIAFAVLSTSGTDLAAAWQALVAAADGAGLSALRVDVAIVLGLTGIDTGGGNLTLLLPASPLTIGDNTGQVITATGATVDLNAAGVSEGLNSTITAANLRLQGSGQFNLTQANAVTTLAANTAGPINFNDVLDLTIGSVLGTSGINTTGNNVTLTPAGRSLTIGG